VGPAYAQQQVHTVAVLRFAGAENVDTFADIFVTELLQSGLYEKVLPQSEVEKASGPNPNIRVSLDVSVEGGKRGLQADQKGLAELGKRLNVDAFLVGTLSRYDIGSDGPLLGLTATPAALAGTVKLLDASTGGVIWSVSFSKTANGQGGFLRPSLDGMASKVSRDVVDEIRKRSFPGSPR